MAHEYRILIGANGWLHTAWQDGFYPDDLPEDWHLGFYSNEFPVVLLTAQLWPRINGEIAEWLEDCNDELGFVCEIPGSLLALTDRDKVISSINEYIEKLLVLQEHLLAIILPVQKMSASLEAIINEINSPVPVCIQLNNETVAEESMSIQKMCEKNRWPLVWQGNGDAAGLGYGSIAMSRINTHDMDMRQLRDVVETILRQTTLEQTAVLIIDGEPPDIAMIRNANVILDLF